MSGTYALAMGDRGRLVVPAPIRSARRLTPGTPLLLLDSDNGLVILTREQALARVRASLVGPSLVDELIGDRRTEAALDGALSE